MDMTAPVPAAQHPATPLRPVREIVLYGDFNCPWSYLASRRAALLAGEGAHIDWRAVEHDAASRRGLAGIANVTAPHRGAPARPVRLGPLLDEMRQVLTLLLPGEELPYALAGFATHTRAALAAYAEAYRAGVAGPVRQVLFEAFWLHAFDLGDPSVVHTLIVDAVRSGATGAGTLSQWDYGSGITHQVSATTQGLMAGWASEWSEAGNQTVPTLVADGVMFHGVEALTWLGTELVRRGLYPADARRQPRSLPALA